MRTAPLTAAETLVLGWLLAFDDWHACRLRSGCSDPVHFDEVKEATEAYILMDQTTAPPPLGVSRLRRGELP